MDNKKITADDLIDLVDRQGRNVDSVRQHVAAARSRYASAAEPMLADLEAAGYKVRTVPEIFSRYHDYRSAVPILLKWLPLVQYINLKSDIVSHLRLKALGSIIVPVLVAEYMSLDDDFMETKWQIGNTLYEIADDNLFDRIAPLIGDAAHGRSRKMLVSALGKMKRRNEEASDLAATVITDPELTGHAINALGKLRALRYRQLIEPYLLSKNAWHKREAQTAIRKMDKAAKIIDENSKTD